MSPPETTPAAAVLPRGSVRLSGTAGCPRWRGRVHLAALFLAVPAGAALLLRRPSPAVAVYVAGLVALYGVSSTYHLMALSPRLRRRLRQADHATIYLFTAASITPFCQYAVAGILGEVVAATAWAGAAAGVLMKVRGFDRSQVTGTALYLAVGWLAALTLPSAAARLSPAQLGLLAGVAVFYTGGAAVLFTRRPDPAPDLFGYHEVWHTAVVAASACYFALLWSLVAGRP